MEVIDGPRAGTVATTDEAGRFSMPGTFTGNVTVTASKDGYTPDTRPVLAQGYPSPPGNAGGSWEIAFSLGPLGPSANIAGVYTLTLTADRACTNLPDNARTRSYVATILPGAKSTSFLARLSDARFVSVYNQLEIGIAGDFAGIGNWDIVEQLQDATFLVVGKSRRVVRPIRNHGAVRWLFPVLPHRAEVDDWRGPGSARPAFSATHAITSSRWSGAELENASRERVSLGAERQRRIDFRCAKRRDVRGQERRGEQDHGGRDQHDRLDGVHSVQETLEQLPDSKRQQQADPDADRRDAAALSQHLPQHLTWVRADRDPDAELARAPGHDVRLDSVDADDGQQQRDSPEHREHPGAGSIEPDVEAPVEMIPPRLDTEDGHALVDIPDDAGDCCQHGPFGVLISNPKLQRHGALVVLPKRHVHMRERPGIAKRVLHGGDDADHANGQPDFRSLFVDELNQPPERALSRPETLRERVIDDRDALRGAGCQFGVAEIPAAKHGKSEDSSVVAADDAEHCVNRPRLRIGGAGRSHQATVPD